MSKVRSRFHLTVKEKLRIIEIFEANSGGAKTLSLRKIADLATAELKRNVSHMSIKKIIKQKDDLKRSQSSRKNDVRVRAVSLVEFEKELKKIFDEVSKRSELNYENAEELAQNQVK